MSLMPRPAWARASLDDSLQPSDSAKFRLRLKQHNIEEEGERRARKGGTIGLKPEPSRKIVHVKEVGSSKGENPLALGNAAEPGVVNGGEQDRGALVHHGESVHQLGVGVGHVSVILGRCADSLGRVLDSVKPGVGIP